MSPITATRPSQIHTTDDDTPDITSVPTGSTDTLMPGEGTRAYLRAAACADGTGDLTEIFFSDRVDDIAQAMTICRDCPLTEQCLTGALDRRERWGVWGGQLLIRGRIARAKRPRGRPPRHARADAGLPVVPLSAALADRIERDGLLAPAR